MDVREKLVELLHKGVRCPGVIANCLDCQYSSIDKPCDEFRATVDMLLANGVTIKDIEIDTAKVLFDEMDAALKDYKESQNPPNHIYGKSMADYQSCDYCDDPHPARDCALPDGIEQMLVCYPDGTIWGKPFIHKRKINFCPMCGRKLLEGE